MTYPTVPVSDYAQLRSTIQNGDILMCSGTGVFSTLIEKATDSVWSHVGFVLRLDAIDRIMVLESVETIGVRTVPLSHYISNYDGKNNGYDGRVFLYRHVEFAAKASVNALKQMSQFAVDLFGYPYDNDEIARITLRIMQKKLGLAQNEVPPRDKEFICSEYAWECYNSLGIVIPPDPSGFIAPCHFASASQTAAVAEIRVS